MTKLVSLAFLSILLASCGGGSSSTTTSSTTATPSQQLEATVASLCTANCNATVPADNPSAQLEATIARLQSSQQTSLGATHGGNMGSSQ